MHPRGNRWGEPKLGSTVPPTEKPSRWTVTSVIVPMADMRTVHVLASLRIAAPLPAALFAAGVAVDAVVAAEQIDSGRERPPFGCPLLRPTPGPQGVAHARRPCHDCPARQRNAGDGAECAD